MKAGTLNVKLVTRKHQGSTGSYQFIILAGFTAQVTHVNADYMETLSPNHVLTRDEITRNIEKFVKHSNAAGHKDITNPSVTKKLDKLFAEPEFTLGDIGKSFSGMGVGLYLS